MSFIMKDVRLKNSIGNSECYLRSFIIVVVFMYVLP